MNRVEKQVVDQAGLQKLQQEYYQRLSRIRYLQQNLEAQEQALFEFISANQADFNQWYMTMSADS